MILGVVLTAAVWSQAATPPIQPPAPPAAATAPPSGDPYAAVRDKMLESITKQRESARKQFDTVRPGTSAPTTEFFTVPWPSTTSASKGFSPVAFSPAGFSTVAWVAPACDPMRPSQLAPLVTRAAERNGLPSEVVEAVIRRESAGYACAVSPAGAMGLMQLMPATASELGIADPWDASANIEGGSRYLRSLVDRFAGDLSLALGAYNAGPRAVERHGGLPPFAETRDYVSSILRSLGGTRSADLPPREQTRGAGN